MAQPKISPDVLAARVDLAGRPGVVRRRIADAIREALAPTIGRPLVQRQCERHGCQATFPVGPAILGGHQSTKRFCCDSCRVMAAVVRRVGAAGKKLTLRLPSDRNGV
jgi:hypothetical protein